MKFKTHSFREADAIMAAKYSTELSEIEDVLNSTSDDELIREFLKKNNKSLSVAINNIIKRKLIGKNWLPEAPLFQDPEYNEGKEKVWRLDFAKDFVSIEVSFNHGEALAWNLTKPTLASETNHVRKARDTKIGVVILVTEDMRVAGGFDGAVGSFEKAIRYLKPMRNSLTIPLLLIGIDKPDTFEIRHEKQANGRNKGIVEKIVNN